MRRIVAMDTETQDGFAILVTTPWMYFEPRSWQDCIDYLSLKDLREMGCWNMDYDGQAIIKYLPRHVRERLAVWGMAQHGFHRIKYVPHKFMKVWEDDGKREKLLFTIYDIKQFYNCSLAKAARKLGVQPKKDFPKSWYRCMKEKLSAANPKTRKVVLEYALGDAQTTQQIIDRTAEAFKLAGLKFEKPYSNASFSERYFRKEMKYRRNSEVEKFAKRAYFGGRIECLRTGYFQKSYHYDIHSAYPSVIANLVKPDGIWTYEKGLTELYDDTQYAFIDCLVDIPRSEYVGPLAMRKRRNQGILYPTGKFRRVLTLCEFKYIERKGWVNKIYSCWYHRHATGKRPFQEVGELYERRRADPRVGYALKIIMNALYGKFAQVHTTNVKAYRISHRTGTVQNSFYRSVTEMKEYTSFVYASEITAQIRMKLLEDIDPSVVISYATDGVFTTEPVKIPQGPGLGQWSEVEEVSDLIVVGSGIYEYKDEENNKTVKFRGFNADLDLFDMLQKAGNRHTVSNRVTRNSSLKMSAMRKEHDSLNVLREVRRTLNVNFDSKRVWSKRWSARELTEQQFTSKPKIFLDPITFQKLKGVIFYRERKTKA